MWQEYWGKVKADDKSLKEFERRTRAIQKAAGGVKTWAEIPKDLNNAVSGGAAAAAM
ncbi:hypothetical protein NEOLEDRAFT_1135178 [Neolentinus lepideus HHB14362 ss-1]|uniref:Uncharacterized protein n=1 Tax=Neolentinus lepideus HHB14362 ss-1 TaxID=1314782 RepID=A0A165RWK4_9AGAM|nr:hypothetical protein NEOLEDRAFT_1135178 [Neolentinus lepideus HHB14362 ss-1]